MKTLRLRAIRLVPKTTAQRSISPLVMYKKRPHPASRETETHHLVHLWRQRPSFQTDRHMQVMAQQSPFPQLPSTATSRNNTSSPTRGTSLSSLSWGLCWMTRSFSSPKLINGSTCYSWLTLELFQSGNAQCACRPMCFQQVGDSTGMRMSAQAKRFNDVLG